MAKAADLLEHARRLGASAGVLLATKELVVKEELAARCREPRCENYGLSPGCPPHTSGPRGFRQLLRGYEQVLFFHIEVPAHVLYSSDNRQLFQFLHEVAAGIEEEAHHLGWSRARAFAGDSCKRLFCEEHKECPALSPGGACRFPRLARPSMSGYGIDVGHLMRRAGWEQQMGKLTENEQTGSTASVCGLVLLD
jgi:predicted metal-binding protein